MNKLVKNSKSILNILWISWSWSIIYICYFEHIHKGILFQSTACTLHYWIYTHLYVWDMGEYKERNGPDSRELKTTKQNNMIAENLLSTTHLPPSLKHKHRSYTPNQLHLTTRSLYKTWRNSCIASIRWKFNLHVLKKRDTSQTRWTMTVTVP